MEKEENVTNMASCANACALKVSATVLENVNLATMQNGLCVVRDLRVENAGSAPLKDVACAISSDEGFMLPGRVEFDELAPGEIVERHEVEALLNQRKILEASEEPVRGSVVVTATAGGKKLCEKRYPMTVFPSDRWVGIEPYPELVAAYVQPCGEFVADVLGAASAALAVATGDGALDGYAGGKKRVKAILEALDGALGALGVAIEDSAAAPVAVGERLRTTGAIGRDKACTRAEASLLLAAALEKAGLHPVMVATKRGCFVGCHLIDTLFEDVVVKSARTFRKRIELDELGIMRCGAAQPEEEFGDDVFICAVDVVRSRENGISSIRSDFGGFGGGGAAATGAPRPATRIERWTQKLLDFSARNRLLNIPKASRQVIRLMCSDVSALEDKIAANKTISVRSIAETIGEKAFEDLQGGRKGAEDFRDAIDAEMAKHRLCVAMTPREVKRRLSDLMHDARTDLEESGVNTLFLTIGELEWMEAGSGANRKAYRAPILMVPVRLQRASMSEGVKMYRLDEDTTVNTTLLEFMRSQFGVSPSGLSPLPVDENGVDVPKVLAAFREAVKGLEGWKVLEEATIGCFSFGKFVMWKDMTERADELKKSPLVNHLIGGGGNFEDGVDVFPASEVSGHASPGELFCPVSYDSSQLTAVLYSELGKSFVLHGPPGTGKSQTITNIIAHNLAKGRRVLFVSEKKAALDVVKNRLDRIGLTPFCLELHSNKTEKNRFYAQLKEALDVPETQAPEDWDRVAADLLMKRAELDGYVRALHRVYPNGLSAYNCFASAILGGGGAHPELIACNCLSQTREEYEAARQAVQDLAVDFRNVSEEALAAIPKLKAASWTPSLESGLRASAEELGSAAAELHKVLAPVLDALKIPPASADLPTLFEVLAALKGMRQTSARFFAEGARNAPATLKELLALRESHEHCAVALSSYRLDAVRELDCDAIAGRIEQNTAKFFVFRFFGERSLAKELAGICKPGAPKLSVATLSRDLPKMRELVAIETEFRAAAGCGIDELAGVTDEQRKLFAYACAKWETFRAALGKFRESADDGVRSLAPDEIAKTCEALLDNISDLRNVMLYRKAEERANAAGVGAFAPFIAANDDGRLDVLRVFDDAYAAKMLSAILASASELAEFSGLAHDARIAKFRELDAKSTELARNAVFARLAASLPRRRSGPCPEGTELGMIKRECEKKTRQKAVRQLLAESRTLVPALKPCFLMSPLSVAQYLPVDAAPFDLIVFDEASQIPVWDAIGVIARGKQLIVVGDPKQMPPTNFFQKGEAEDDDETTEAVADQESILDECLVAGVYSAYLSWHYRSRHESLIAFSNEHYYANKLCTFPAASSSPRLGVKFHFVPGGRFVKTGNGPRVNEVEAKALVDYVCEQVLAPGYKPRSIGIVTFSMPQQKLIRSMLEERRAENAKLERLLPEEGEGAFFVKNLENVQGDESDVILFSVGYAPDEDDRFTMNFGPLNLTGGERRLNVAVTRSKEQVVVFSSIHASQIDAGEFGRTKAVGAGHLKAFLEYAEKISRPSQPSQPAQPSQLSLPSQPSQSSQPSSFPDAVAEFLREKGYCVERDVGCSEHRVDIAVRDAENPERYLVGIECDGPAYARQRTAQDRDVNRAGVLRGLGWKMLRVWCVDWALDRARAEQRLLEAIEAERAEKSEGQGTEDIRPATEDIQPAATDLRPSTKDLRPSTKDLQPGLEEYCLWKAPKIGNDDFYALTSRQKIAKMISAVIATEGPIYENTMKKRIARAWGLTRITENVQRVFDAAMPKDCVCTEHDTGRVLWPRDADPDAYSIFRVPSKSDPKTRRALDEIPPEELRNAMRRTLEDFGQCGRDDLYREAIKSFGLAALTSRARRFLDTAYNLMKR